MIHFLTLARNDQDANDLLRSISRYSVKEEISFVGANMKAKFMAEGYNSLVKNMTDIFNYKDTDVLCFIHTDARIHFQPHLIEMFYENHPEAGVIGFVGCKRLTIDGRWWVSEPRVGKLIQGNIDTEDPNLTFDPVDVYTEVDSVDGYCMFIRCKTLKEVGGFDERYGGWHFYDADLCTEVRMKGYKNYVIDLLSQHFSGGELNEDWQRSQEIFKDKWKEVLN